MGFKVGDVVRLNEEAISTGDWCNNCRGHILKVTKILGNNKVEVMGKTKIENKPIHHLEHVSWKLRFSK